MSNVRPSEAVARRALSTDLRSPRQLFHTVGDNRSQLHDLLAQFSVLRNVALNAIAIGLQFSAERLKLTDEIISTDRGSCRARVRTQPSSGLAPGGI